MAAPTPGPWRTKKFKDIKSWSIYAAGSHRSLASVRTEEDARLIAAAPQMLEALRGPDPEMPEAIQPLGWLRTLIDESRRMYAEREAQDDDDPDAFYQMFREVEELWQRARAAITAATGAEA